MRERRFEDQRYEKLTEQYSQHLNTCETCGGAMRANPSCHGYRERYNEYCESGKELCQLIWPRTF